MRTLSTGSFSARDAHNLRNSALLPLPPAFLLRGLGRVKNGIAKVIAIRRSRGLLARRIRGAGLSISAIVRFSQIVGEINLLEPPRQHDRDDEHHEGRDHDDDSYERMRPLISREGHDCGRGRERHEHRDGTEAGRTGK